MSHASASLTVHDWKNIYNDKTWILHLINHMNYKTYSTEHVINQKRNEIKSLFYKVTIIAITGYSTFNNIKIMCKEMNDEILIKPASAHVLYEYRKTWMKWNMKWYKKNNINAIKDGYYITYTRVRCWSLPSKRCVQLLVIIIGCMINSNQWR